MLAIADAIGHIPLPPYIKREDTAADKERYQTVFAKQPGSVAAPTAALHFTDDLLNQFSDTGIDRSFVDLSVGLRTKPVSENDISAHVMHAERCLARRHRCRHQGNESCWRPWSLLPVQR